MNIIHCRKTSNGKYIFRIYSTHIGYFDRAMTRNELLQYLEFHKIGKRKKKSLGCIIDEVVEKAKLENVLHSPWLDEPHKSSY